MTTLVIPEEIGEYILGVCHILCPCDRGDDAFAWFAKDWGGGGTTCGFLPPAVMYAAGIRHPLVNRNEPEAGLKYVNGANISKIWNLGKPPFTNWKAGGAPPPNGSILFVSNGDPNSEHVCILWKIEDGFWHTYDGGQKNKKGQECLRARKRTFTRGHILDGRKLVGYIAPGAIPCTAPALDLTEEILPDSWWPPPHRDPYTGEMLP